MRVRFWYLSGAVFTLLAGSWLIAAEKKAEALAKVVEDRMRKDITFLASDECEGRGVTTKGINLAADYIANEFKKAGLKPLGDKDTYFQPFTIVTGGAKMETPNTLVLYGPKDQKIELELGKEFLPIGLAESGKVKAEVVFLGYGATAEKIGYDDYKDIDVKDKIVVILRKTPRPDDTKAPFDGPANVMHAGLQTKLALAGLHKAAAVLFVNDRATAKAGDKLMEFAYLANARQSMGLPAAHLSRSVLDSMLESSLDQKLVDREKAIDEDLKPKSAALKGWTAELEVNVKREKTEIKNIVGVLEGKGAHAKETVILGAHYDHLGYGGRGSGSLARDQKDPTIHHGADDNGSGTTTLIELARRFGEIPNREGRRLVFMAFSGEEMGLLGSHYYCEHPLIPLADTVAMINIDMVGRVRKDKTSEKDKLYVYGTGTSQGFDAVMTDLNKKYDFQLQKTAGTRMAGGSSDHASFYAKKIPVIFFFSGNHPDYHRPTDTADKINVPGMAKVADMTEDLLEHLATQKETPDFIKVEEKVTSGPGPSGPRLGIMPNYGDDQDGVLLDGVSQGPAEKAGMKEGDRIVEIDGKPVKNLEVYMVLMAGHKKGETLEVAIVRDGKKQTVKVKLE